MQIHSSETLSGYPILKVRNLVKKLRQSNTWTVKSISYYMKISASESQSLLMALSGLKYVEPADVPESWRVSDLGLRFSNASGARPIARKSAERILRDFMTRVDEVNWNSYYLYKVRRVVAFGSYLTDADKLGDIDLAVTLEPSELDKEKQGKLEKERIDKAVNKGRHFSTFLEELIWPRREVLLFLKSHSRAIQIHSDTDGVLEKTKTKVIFERSSKT